MTNTFNNKEIKAIYDLYICGLSLNEIRSIFFGKTIYEIIKERIIDLAEEVQEHNKNKLYELENVNMVNLVKNSNERKILINRLEDMKEEVSSEVKYKMDKIILLINNIDRIQNDCIKNITIRDKKEINDSRIIGKMIEELPDIISKKSENIISEEEWERVKQLKSCNFM